jgi:hypothetical protein
VGIVTEQRIEQEADIERRTEATQDIVTEAKGASAVDTD